MKDELFDIIINKLIHDYLYTYSKIFINNKSLVSKTLNINISFIYSELFHYHEDSYSIAVIIENQIYYKINVITIYNNETYDIVKVNDYSAESLDLIELQKLVLEMIWR